VSHVGFCVEAGSRRKLRSQIGQRRTEVVQLSAQVIPKVHPMEGNRFRAGRCGQLPEGWSRVCALNRSKTACDKMKSTDASASDRNERIAFR